MVVLSISVAILGANCWNQSESLHLSWWIKSATFAYRFTWRWERICIAESLVCEAHLWVQKWILCPLPITHTMFELKVLHNCFIPDHKDDFTWFQTYTPSLKTLALSISTNWVVEEANFQVRDRIKALFSALKERSLSCPSLRGLKFFFQETVTRFLCSQSPNQMKLRTCLSN